MTVRQPNCVICSAAILPQEGRTGPHCSRPACAARYAGMPARLKCSACGNPLAAGEATAGVCAAAACQQEVVRQHNRTAERRRREDAERWAVLAEQVRPAAAATLGLADAGRYPLAVIPRAEPRLTPLPPDRRATLAGFLTRMIAEAMIPCADPPTDVLPPEAEPGLAAVLGQACGLCEGFCCGLGANSGYLTVQTIRRYRLSHPDKSADELLADYLSRLAEESVEGSCIYHQATGCGLTREMRSETCNRHFCQGLKEFRRAHGDKPPVRGFFVTVRDGLVGAAAFIDATGTHGVGTGLATGPAGITPP